MDYWLFGYALGLYLYVYCGIPTGDSGGNRGVSRAAGAAEILH